MKLQGSLVALITLFANLQAVTAHIPDAYPSGAESVLQYHLSQESFDFDNSSDLPFNVDYFGLGTYMYTKPMRCFGANKEEKYDVAVLGAPFDTTTTYRPGYDILPLYFYL